MASNLSTASKTARHTEEPQLTSGSKAIDCAAGTWPLAAGTWPLAAGTWPLEEVKAGVLASFFLSHFTEKESEAWEKLFS